MMKIPASILISPPLLASLTKATVKPAVEAVLPQTITERGAILPAARHS